MRTRTSGATIHAVRFTRWVGGAVALVCGITLLVGVAAAGAALPDSRGYEMVSPDEKGASDVTPIEFFAADRPVAAESGELAGFTSRAAFADPQGGAAINQYLSTRGPGGWTSRNITPRQNTAGTLASSNGLAWSADLLHWEFASAPNPPLVLGAPADTLNLYLRDNGSDSLSLLTVGAPDTLGPFFQIADRAGASNDFSHVAIKGLIPLTGDSPPGLSSYLYEWQAGALRYVGVLPGGTISATDAVDIAGPAPTHSVSDDGSRIFFYTPSDGPARQLYVRENGGLAGASTVQLSAPAAGAPADPTALATFQIASTNGSVAFFTSHQRLTSDATSGPGPSDTDLYRFDVAGGTLSDITSDGTDANGAQVGGVLGASDDGSRVYFVARGNLATGATVGDNNVYLWHDDGSAHGTIRFVTKLADTDSELWRPDAETHFVRTSGDGQHIAFPSSLSLTGFPNAGHLEIYLYDAVADQLVCASCSPTGDTPAGDASFTTNFGNILGTEWMGRNLSADGSRLFFQTPEALVPQDTNGRQDVYEWEGGAARLISSGGGDSDAVFQDAGLSGDDVFFTTAQQLVRSDADHLVDLYDARVDGGFPDDSPPPPCSGDACKPPLSAPPPGGTPGSATFFGPGNEPAGDDGSASSRRGARLRVASISAAQRRAFARTGRLGLKLTVAGPGTVSGKLLAKLGKRFKTVDSASKHAGKAGTVRLTLHLSSAARDALSARGRLALRIRVRFGSTTRQANLILKEGRR